jgi:hypothetical protein
MWHIRGLLLLHRRSQLGLHLFIMTVWENLDPTTEEHMREDHMPRSFQQE